MLLSATEIVRSSELWSLPPAFYLSGDVIRLECQVWLVAGWCLCRIFYNDSVFLILPGFYVFSRLSSVSYSQLRDWLWLTIRIALEKL